ncbi:NUDIX domain-containing protein [Candidatus Pacearchaeota archaeon]|nr:NUDIX domain-containing protein [Candidatus Pacearchaeota archaeon]
MNENIVRVGIAAVIQKDGKVLFHKRKGKHAPGVWAFAGGHLEFNEGLEEAIRREIKEETGLDVGKVTGPIFVANNTYPNEGKHYITLFMNAEYIGGEAKIMEPEKCECWNWFSKEELPENLMPPIIDLIKSDYNIFEGIK